MTKLFRFAMCAASLALGACSFDSPGLPSGDGGQDAPGADAAPDGPAACPGDALGFTPSNLALCDIPAPGNALTIPEPGEVWNFSTDTGLLRLNDGSATIEVPGGPVAQASGPDVFVISTQSLVLQGRVRTYGTRPLAIVSFGDVSVVAGARLFATEVAGKGPGPGAGLAEFCDATGGTGPDGPVQDGVVGNAGAGGGGGGYGEGGGEGAGVLDILPRTAGGQANGNAEITPLRGGCNGGGGGGSGGGGGGGGGAIQIVAAGQIALAPNGIVAAFGFGGKGGTSLSSGGGGGGSGGAILLEAPAVFVRGALTANGGGGGEGTRDAGLDAGKNGISGSASTRVPAAGGTGGNGGDGGTGAAGGASARGGDPGLPSLTRAAGAGAGGGGPGRIRVNGTEVELSQATLSPDATTGTLAP